MTLVKYISSISIYAFFAKMTQVALIEIAGIVKSFSFKFDSSVQTPTKFIFKVLEWIEDNLKLPSVVTILSDLTFKYLVFIVNNEYLGRVEYQELLDKVEQKKSIDFRFTISEVKWLLK